MVVARSWGRAKGSCRLMGTASVQQDEEVLEMFHDNMTILNTSELYT